MRFVWNESICSIYFQLTRGNHENYFTNCPVILPWWVSTGSSPEFTIFRIKILVWVDFPQSIEWYSYEALCSAVTALISCFGCLGNRLLRGRNHSSLRIKKSKSLLEVSTLQTHLYSGNFFSSNNPKVLETALPMYESHYLLERTYSSVFIPACTSLLYALRDDSKADIWRPHFRTVLSNLNKIAE